MDLQGAVARLLGLDPAGVALSAVHGGDSSARTAKVTAHDSVYFVKHAAGDEARIMLLGEHESLNAIHSVDPSLCPRSHGCDQFQSSYFLITDYLPLSRSSDQSRTSLAEALARLHTTPAPPPEGLSTPMFGFPVVTCCGDTPQDNTFTPSWATFFADRRLRHILGRCELRHGPDGELARAVEAVATTVVPRLLGDDHINNGRGVTPVVVHGDLWSGNAGCVQTDRGARGVVFDPSAFYGHGEYDLGIMDLFGGFPASFYAEYYRRSPKTEPVSEYDDRVKLYGLYHQLNHYALFGGSYRSGAMRTMSGLVAKYLA